MRLHEVMIIVAALSIQDPRERPQEKQQASDENIDVFADKKSDFLAFLNIWRYLQEQQKELSKNQFRRQCQKDFFEIICAFANGRIFINKFALPCVKWACRLIRKKPNISKFTPHF